jgi:DNA polymerase-3 subunit chi
MTEISFHFNVPDRTAYACRLLRKASRSGARVAVTAGTEVLAELDRALWAFDPVEFVPHVRLASGQAPSERLAPTPIWLVDDASGAPHHEVLVNLGEASPAGFESYARLIEIVSTADADRAAARQRWRHYADRGYPIERHEVAA